MIDDFGAYFIDRDGTHFRHILNYLRGNFDVKSLTENEVKQLSVEADYYGLHKMVDLLVPKKLYEAHWADNIFDK